LENLVRRPAALVPVVLAVLAGGMAVAPPASAVDNRFCTIDWRAGVDGAWESPTSWRDPDDGLPRVPDADDHVCIDEGGRYTVSVSTPVVVQSIDVTTFSRDVTLALTPEEGTTASVEVTDPFAFGEIRLNDARLLLGDDLHRGGTAVVRSPVDVDRVETHGDAGAVRRFDSRLHAERSLVVDGPTVAEIGVRTHALSTTAAGRLEVPGGFVGEFRDSFSVTGAVVNEGSIDVRDSRVFFGTLSTQTGQPIRLHGGVLNDLAGQNDVEIHGSVRLELFDTDFKSTIGFVGGDSTDDRLVVGANINTVIDSRLRFVQQPTSSGRGGTATVLTEPGATLRFSHWVMSEAAAGAPVGTLRLEGDLLFSQDRFYGTRAGSGTLLEVLDRSRGSLPGLVDSGRFSADPGGRLRFAAPVTELAGEVLLQPGSVVEDTNGVAFPTTLHTVRPGGALRLRDVTARVPALTHRGTVDLLAGGRLEAPQGYHGEEASRTVLSGGELVTPVLRLQRAELVGTGTLRGDLDVDNGIVSGGTLEPYAPGALSVTGSARLLNGTNLVTTVAGPEPAQYSRLLVGGRVEAPQGPTVITPESYVPAEGSRHRTITAGLDSILPSTANSKRADYRTAGPEYSVETTARTFDLPAGGAPTRDNPLVSALTVPPGGPARLEESAGPQQVAAGWEDVGQRVDVLASDATAEDPLRLRLAVDGSVLPDGEGGGTLTVHRDGSPVTTCAVEGALGPDPCVTARGDEGDDGVVTVLTTVAGRFAPSVPERGSLAAACPPTSGSGFEDVSDGSAHAAAVRCLSDRGIVRGTGPTVYSPDRPVSRAQTASLVARLLSEASPAVLPQSPPDAFLDDEGSPHERAINQLAAIGVVRGSGGAFSPAASVTRAQMASLLDRAYGVLGEWDGLAPDAFGDDQGGVHEPATNRLAALGITGGSGPGAFSPDRQVRRDQIASFVARLLSRFTAEGAL
jgi:hypothetical protein